MKIAIIGAGPAGLTAIKYCVQEGYECEAFEQTEFIGGTWNYTDEVGIDKNGLPVHTSMYKNLRTNLPKELMMFENFPYPESIKESYITQSQVLDYINDYAEKMDLKKYVKFLTLVTNVKPIEGKRWEIEFEDVITKQQFLKQFDAVICCNGKYQKPYIPIIPGLETFTGSCIHSHNYRNTEPYKDKVVLVVGAGPSGIDITRQLHNDAKKVYISATPRLSQSIPESLNKVSVIKTIDKNMVHFVDQSCLEICDIILCTGYDCTFNFLNEECKIKVENNHVKGLYKECLCIEFPTFIILGLPMQIIPIPTFQIQIKFFDQILKNKCFLPTRDQMIEEEKVARGLKDCPNRLFHRKTVEQEREYWDDLSVIANVQKVPSVVTALHDYIIKQKRDTSQCYKIIDDDTFERIF